MRTHRATSELGPPPRIIEPDLPPPPPVPAEIHGVDPFAAPTVEPPPLRARPESMSRGEMPALRLPTPPVPAARPPLPMVASGAYAPPPRRPHFGRALAIIAAVAASCVVVEAERVDDDATIFRLYAPDAETVALVGDFNDWSLGSTRLTGPDEDGWWMTRVSLDVGRHTYAYSVDGSALFVPEDEPMQVDDGFGGNVAVTYVFERDPGD